jgi:hypothetical protein
MTIYTVKLLAGYRLLLTKNATWEKFLKDLAGGLYEEGLETDVESCDEEESCDSGEEGSDEESCESDGESEGENEASCDFPEKTLEHLERFIARIFEEDAGIDDVVVNVTSHFHSKNGIDRVIDIGFEVGEFSVDGTNKGSRQKMTKLETAMKKARSAKFTKTLSNTFLWTFVGSKAEPQVLAVTDGCIDCE